MKNKLDAARDVINEVDAKMAELFVKRMKAVEQVAEYKRAENLPILDVQRESVVIEKNTKRIEEESLRPYYTEFITNLMSISRNYQQYLQQSVESKEL